MTETAITLPSSSPFEDLRTLRWKSDDIDLMCGKWAEQRRKILGIILPKKLEPREILGKLRCTLGNLHSEQEGAGERTANVNEFGHVNQNWPEVYTGDSLLVHRAWCSMRGPLRLTMDGQYVWREIPVKLKAAEFGFSVAQYWINVTALKEYVNGYVNRGIVEAPPRLGMPQLAMGA